MGGSERLQDLLADSEPLQLHQSFGFWEIDGEEIEHASHAIVPTEEIGTDAFWCTFPDRTVIRWVIAEDEDRVLDALARLSAAGALPVGESGRYLGAFRADGIMIPVWQVQGDAPTMTAPFNELRERFGKVLSSSAPLTDAERRARSGLIGRNLTIR